MKARRYKSCFFIVLASMTVLSSCSFFEAPLYMEGLSILRDEENPSMASRTETFQTTQLHSVQMFDPENLTELENRSEYIVRGTLRDDAMPNLQYCDDVVTYGVTVSTLDILEVYKGDLEGVDSIPLGEEYYIDPHDGLFYRGNYFPSVIGREYVFFLERQDEFVNGKQSPIGGIYFPWGYEDGRFPVPSATARGAVMDAEALPNEELNLGPDSSEQYRSLYQEVIDKYMAD